MSVYPSDHIPNDAPIGGKARNLLELQSAGLNVPKWCVVPSEDLSQLLPDFVRSAQDYNAVRQAIEKTELPSQIVNDIIGLFPGVEYFAVRSSALDEDGSSFSFAGQFESHLYVPVDDLLNRVKRVWLSAYSERVFAYRSANGLGPSQGIAVIVQEMVPADVAGVAFGVNPVTGDRRACVVSAVYGLGEGLVSGELDADTYIVKDLNIERTIIKKEYTFV
ncbi:MAG TPA: PEP/pyruvate-binding domain-containing protein, partial [Chitinophagales bacterium]|nr:PEP/pyruvate-binding domain-containing protein [Chitinophagales bacterium]